MAHDDYAIWKFAFIINDEIAIEIPKGAEVLTARMTPRITNCIDIWAHVPIHADLEFKTFYVRGTGHQVQDNLRWITTVHDDVYGLVWHIFEEENE